MIEKPNVFFSQCFIFCIFEIHCVKKKLHGKQISHLLQESAEDWYRIQFVQKHQNETYACFCEGFLCLPYLLVLFVSIEYISPCAKQVFFGFFCNTRPSVQNNKRKTWLNDSLGHKIIPQNFKVIDSDLDHCKAFYF